jgi:hypothetical protein
MSMLRGASKLGAINTKMQSKVGKRYYALIFRLGYRELVVVKTLCARSKLDSL